MGKDRFVIKTGAGDYLEKGYPHAVSYTHLTLPTIA